MDVTHSVDAYLLRELNRRCNFNANQLVQCRDLILALRNPGSVTDRSVMRSLVEVDMLNIDTIMDYSDNELAILLEQIDNSLRMGSFEVVTIHDEFKCHANHMNKLRKHYNIILWEMYHSDLLASIVKQISGLVLHTLPFDQNVANAILDADYPIN